ncbi:MAG TPA: hypothetical protein VLG40_02160 [Candidatus Saccharimonas sp.]|nr:hypothetical protein [Candidatus Saccharimonas sp.]
MAEAAGTLHALCLVLDEAADARILASCDYATVTIGGRLMEDLPAIGLKAGQLVRLAVHEDAAQTASVARMLADAKVAAHLQSLAAQEVLTLYSDNNAGLDAHIFVATICVEVGTEHSVAAALLAAIQAKVKQADDVVVPSVLAMILAKPGVIMFYGVSGEQEWFDDFEGKALTAALSEVGIDPAHIHIVYMDDFFAIAPDDLQYYVATT